MSTHLKPKPEPMLIIPLDAPIESGKTIYTELTLAEPKARAVLEAEKHLKGPSLGPSDLRLYQLTLVSQTAGIPFSDLRDLFPISVINEASRYLQGFLEAGEPIGESASAG